MHSQRRSQFEHDHRRRADQATGSLAHIMGEAWTGPNRRPNGRENAVRVQARGKPLDGTKPCAREALTIHFCWEMYLTFLNNINAQIFITFSDRVERRELSVSSTP